MALPKLEAARYIAELPISKKKVEYRPFLVKEQKVLLIALESEETEQATSSMMELLQNCVFNHEEIGKLEDLPMMDIEFLFVQIRIKSVGETVDVIIPCDKCADTTELTIDLTEAGVTGEVPDPKIELLDGIGMTLSYPTMTMAMQEESDEQTEAVFNMIYNSIETIYNGDEVFTRDDIDRKELEEFLDQFTADQFQKVQDYFMNTPRYSKNVNFVCSKCETVNDKELVGVMDFFA